MNDLEKLIFGKNQESSIVSIEIQDSSVELFQQDASGAISSKFLPNKHWILSNRPLNKDFVHLKGDLFYSWGIQFENREDFLKARNYWRREDIYSVFDPKEACMLNYGYTYFKNLKIEDVSILSCDIETNGLKHDNDSLVLLITNTYRDSKGSIVRKLFAIDEFHSQSEMLQNWCKWVCEVNPSIISFHNGYSFDFPFLQHCADLAGIQLELGRDNSPLRFNTYESKFRVDGSRDLHYNKCYIYGREIIDTMFLAIKYDISRQFDSYALKPIIKQLGLEKKDRQFYDASKIRENYKIPEEWNKIKIYAEEDSDDGLKLFDKFAPPFFYFCQSVPKSFQLLCESATGSQLNAILVRSYLQERHSIPKTNEVSDFRGGISMGNPGIWNNCMKVDVSSLYPSIILQYQIYDKKKDPNGNFLKMVEYFTKERLKNKKLANETNNAYFSGLEQSQKIGINSAYGLLSTNGLSFNSPENGSLITQHGRDILKKSIKWATGNDYEETV